MDNFKGYVLSLIDRVFPVTPKMRIQQKEQTELKNGLTEALMLDMQDAGIEVYQVQKGFVALIQNDEEGAIPVEINIITKPLDYDYFALHSEYIEKQKEE